MSDLQKWLGSIRDGDKAAFEALYEEMKRPLFTIILRITGDRGKSEDLLQELFLKLYLSPLETPANSRAYLCQMAHNLAIDSVRKQKPYVDWEQAEETLSCQMSDIGQSMDIEDAIQTLPKRELQIVTLHLNGELKFREIAAILKIPLGTVLWSYRKAIEKLQKILGGAI
jgi:RNA polymerase sigma-70 factor (ECF subfamily)